MMVGVLIGLIGGTDLMLASVLRLSGLDKAPEALKLTLEEKAHEAVDDVKGVIVRMVVVAALAVAGAIFALLAVITGLLVLYEWMEPYGIFLALSFVGGVLAVIALVLISAAMILSRGRPSNEKSTATPKTIEVPPGPLPLSVTPAPVAHSPPLGLLRSTTLFARWNRASSCDEGCCHARGKARSDRGSRNNARLLGAAMAFGWLLVKIAKPSDSNR